MINFRKAVLLVLVNLLLGMPIYAQHFNIATYNLRNANHEDSLNGDGWGQRCLVISSLIQFHEFDIFGTQEGFYHQLEDLKKNLPGYTYIGVGRDDGKQAGEHSAIFYKKDKFELLNKGDFWLSKITDKPNKGWDAVLPRICSWGKFKERSTGFVFCFFNLHMDHVGVQARAESAKLILQKIKEFPANTPVILTGDFNVDQASESYKLINTSGVLKDGFDLSLLKYALNGTFNAFNPNTKSDSRIDHIFVSKQFTVKRYGILTETYRGKKNGSLNQTAMDNENDYIARVPSDHFPVMIEVKH